MTTLTRGATRADGYRFWAYAKKDGRFREKWYSPDAFDRAVATVKKLRSAWGKQRSETHYNNGGNSPCRFTPTFMTTDSNAVTCTWCNKWLTMQQQGAK
jgi:hypothetical protein